MSHDRVDDYDADDKPRVIPTEAPSLGAIVDGDVTTPCTDAYAESIGAKAPPKPGVSRMVAPEPREPEVSPDCVGVVLAIEELTDVMREIKVHVVGGSKARDAELDALRGEMETLREKIYTIIRMGEENAATKPARLACAVEGCDKPRIYSRWTCEDHAKIPDETSEPRDPASQAKT